MFKTSFGFESYLKILPTNSRIPLTKFRCGSHNLPISNARYDPIDVSNICSLCHDDIGDEFHYLFVCRAFSHMRTKLIKPYYFTNPNTLKFKHLMESTNIGILRNLSLFVKYVIHVFRP